MNPYYQDKWVTIYHGDCREILPQLDVKVDLVLTDPPYQMRGGGVPIKGYGVAKMYKETKTIGEPWGYDNKWITHILKIGPSHFACFCNSYMVGDICYRINASMIPICLFTWWKRNAPPTTKMQHFLGVNYLIFHF